MVKPAPEGLALVLALDTFFFNLVDFTGMGFLTQTSDNNLISKLNVV